MTKKYNLNKILFMTIFSCFLIIGGIYSNFSPIVFAQESSQSEIFTITAYDRISGDEITATSTSFTNNESIPTYNWKNASKLILTAQVEYIESFTIDYYQSYATSNFNNEGISESITLSSSDYTFSAGIFSFEYNIDNGITRDTESVIQSFKGWGIYTFTINDNEDNPSTSIFIAPNNEDIKPEFVVNKQKIGRTKYYDYTCTIKNADDFRYSDTNKIVWYVNGESEEGFKYCLTEQDYTSATNEFKNYLYDNDKNRTGLEFNFNTKKRNKTDEYIDGSWTIYCTFKPNEDVNQSNSIVVKSGFEFNVTVFAICTVSASLVACGVVALWQFIKTKKEKVW